MAVGTLLSAGVAGLQPYNDFVVGNGFLIACYLPVVVVFAAFGLTVCVNAPLRRWVPGRAFSAGESAVVMAMLLAACSVPCQGVLRALLPMLVYPFHRGATDHDFWQAFAGLGLPRWLFPVDDIATGRGSPAVTWFYARVPAGEVVPYGAWVRPMLAWGSLLGCTFAAVIAGAALVFPQWATAERLAFPIGQVELALLAPPEHRRKAFGPTLASRGFWVAALVAFVLQCVGPLHSYFPKRVPDLSLTYDFQKLATGEPWTYFSVSLMRNGVVFLFVGMAYFIQARVGFSIWATFVIMQLVRVSAQTRLAYDLTNAALLDEHLGASIAYLAGVLWVGRRGYRRMVFDRRHRRPVALSILVVGVGGMATWLLALGVSPTMTVLSVAFALTAHLVVARVVAETGLPIFRWYGSPSQVYQRLPAAAFSPRDVFFAQATTLTGTYTTRESAAVFVQHGLWVFDRASDHPARDRRRLLAVIGWAVVVSFGVGCWSSLHAYYAHAVPLTRQLPQVKINPYAVETLPTDQIATPLTARAHGHYPTPAHRPLVHVGVGATVAAVLSVLALRAQAWPFLPVGYVVDTMPYIHWCWYSVMLGWLAKVLVLRLGGAKAYTAAKPAFVGLIVGEALAAAAWLAVNIALAATGHDYHPVLIYPS